MGIHVISKSVTMWCVYRERSGSVVECLTRNRGVMPVRAYNRRHRIVSFKARHVNPCLALVQPIDLS